MNAVGRVGLQARQNDHDKIALKINWFGRSRGKVHRVEERSNVQG